MATSPDPTPRQKSASAALIWPADTELVGLVFELTPRAASSLYAQYAIGLHAWFLYQVQETDPDLSHFCTTISQKKALRFRDWKVI